MNFKKSFCWRSNFSDDIISVLVCEHVCCVLGAPPGQKTSMENNIFWSEIGSGFGEPGGTTSTRIPRGAPLPPLGYFKVLVRHTNFMCHHTQVTASISNRDPLSPWAWLATYHRIAPITEKQPKKPWVKAYFGMISSGPNSVTQSYYQSLQICLPLCCVSHIWVNSTDEKPLIKDLRKKIIKQNVTRHQKRSWDNGRDNWRFYGRTEDIWLFPSNDS